MLEKNAADIIMIDPTWAGGITESKDRHHGPAWKRPVAMHDCTGLYADGRSPPGDQCHQRRLPGDCARLPAHQLSQLVTEGVTVEQGHIPGPDQTWTGDDLVA